MGLAFDAEGPCEISQGPFWFAFLVFFVSGVWLRLQGYEGGFGGLGLGDEKKSKIRCRFGHLKKLVESGLE
jgi:hypothetical protein